MTAAHHTPTCTSWSTELNPAQADAVRALVLQLVTPASASGQTLPRKLAFIGTLEAEEDFAERSETDPRRDRPRQRRHEPLMLLTDTGPLVATANTRDRTTRLQDLL